MKIDNRKTFIKRLLSGTMSKEQRKIFIQLDEIDFQLRKQWDEAGNESKFGETSKINKIIKTEDSFKCFPNGK